MHSLARVFLASKQKYGFSGYLGLVRPKIRPPASVSLSICQGGFYAYAVSGKLLCAGPFMNIPIIYCMKLDMYRQLYSVTG